MNGTICLNADIGELPGPEGRLADSQILQFVNRCNIACGGHAGDDETMIATLRLAAQAGVLAGAHPSYPDRENFGRLVRKYPPEELRAALRSQVERLLAAAAMSRTDIDHLKPHGALYNQAALDPDLAGMVADVCRESGIGLLIGPPASCLEVAAKRAGLRYMAEGFADRSYERDGSLTPRSLPGSILDDMDLQLQQALGIVRSGIVRSRTGETVRLSVGTICLHGDSPGAAECAGYLHAQLKAAGVRLGP